jgi:hypothetical protein
MILAPPIWFALVYVALQLVWWVSPRPADGALAWDILAEVAIFGSAIAFAAYQLKAQHSQVSTNDRKKLAAVCTVVAWITAFVLGVAQMAAESFAPLRELIGQADIPAWTWVVAAVAVVGILGLLTTVYYAFALLIIRIAIPLNRIAAQ